MLQQETKCLKPGPGFRKSLLKPMQVRSGERGNPGLAHDYGFFRIDALQPQLERKQSFEHQSGLEPLAQRLDAVWRKINRQRLAAAFEPKTLHQHEKSA